MRDTDFRADSRSLRIGRWLWCAVIPILCSALPSCAETADQSSAGLGPSETTQHRIDEFIQCLPSDWETLLVSNRPGQFGVHSDFAVKPFIDSLAHAPLGMAAFSEDVRSVFQGRGLTVAVGASREFRRATGLGTSIFEGASLIVFEEDLPNLKEEFSRQIAAGAFHSLTIAGSEVLSFEAEIEEDLWKLYLFQPSGKTLVVATDESFLGDVLGCLAGDSTPSDLPTDLPQWEALDRDASIWGMRHYRSRPSGEDVSSHLFFSDPYAIGLAVMLREGRDANTVHVVYFSESPTSLEMVKTLWDNSLARNNTSPTFSQHPDGSVRIELRGEDLNNADCAVTLGEILGHGLNI